MQTTSHQHIVITGATGLIGTALCDILMQRGHDLVIFSRHPQAAAEKIPGAAAYVAWDIDGVGAWRQHIDGAAAVIHLAGAPIFAFGHRQTRAAISQETRRRIQGIDELVRAMEAATVKPAVFISASSVGTYGYRGFSDDVLGEDSPPGTDAWGQESVAWEGAALAATGLGVRVVVLRTGYVLAASGGGLAQQADQFRRGFGGPVLPGKQWLPWIHLTDEVGLIHMALTDARVRGPLNCTAPDVPRNRDFAATLGSVLGKPSRVPTPGFALRMGLGVTADIIVHGRRVIPQKALELGYSFQFPTLASALRDLLMP